MGAKSKESKDEQSGQNMQRRGKCLVIAINYLKLYFTNIWLLASMDAHMNRQFVLARQSLPANTALERFICICNYKQTDRE